MGSKLALQGLQQVQLCLLEAVIASEMCRVDKD